MKNKYPFCIKLLEDRIILEKHWLDIFNKHYNEDVEWAKSNIDCCNFRISELENCIQILKDIK